MDTGGRNRARLVVIGGLASFGPLSLDLYLPALPRVGAALGAGPGVTQLSVSACLVGLAVGQAVFGPLGDRYGRRRPLLVGVALWTLAALACALAPDAPALIALRAIQGLGGAAGLVLSRAVVRDLYDHAALARAFAVVALMSNVAPAVAPLAGGALLTIMSWRGLFYVLAGTGALLLGGVVAFLPESLPAERRRGTGLRATLAVGRELAGDALFRGAAGAFALASAMLFTYLSLSSFVLQRHEGLGAGGYALVFAANSVGILLAGTLTIRLLATRSARALLRGGLTAGAASTVALAGLALAGAPAWALLIALCAAIASVGTTFPTATALALMPASDAAGAGSALLGAVQYGVGALAGALVSLLGETPATMSMAMAVFALAGWGVAVCARLGPTAAVPVLADP